MTVSRSSPVLVADVGGTNVRFALATVDAAAPLQRSSIRRYRVADFPSLDAAASDYLRETGARPQRAVLAIAGRVENGRVHATNSPWRIVAEEVRQALGLASVRLINDFAAQSMCLPLLAAKDLMPIGDTPAPRVGGSEAQTFAVVGPGTGLGVGGLLLRDGRFLALDTEGGHSGFAPSTPEEIDVLKCLAARFGHVSNERLISGIGLVSLHQALAEVAGMACTELTPEQITAHAQAGTDALCVHAIEVFCAIFGTVAGDVALSLGSWDGVYLAGGLPPLLMPWLNAGEFRDRFEDKGRLAASMRRVPTVVIADPDAGLLGTAAWAIQEAGASLLRPPVAHAV